MRDPSSSISRLLFVDWDHEVHWSPGEHAWRIKRNERLLDGTTAATITEGKQTMQLREGCRSLTAVLPRELSTLKSAGGCARCAGKPKPAHVATLAKDSAAVEAEDFCALWCSLIGHSSATGLASRPRARGRSAQLCVSGLTPILAIESSHGSASSVGKGASVSGVNSWMMGLRVGTGIGAGVGPNPPWPASLPSAHT